MKLSVLVPAYNEAEVIGATLSHIQSTIAPHELFVTDAASTDSTATIAAQYAEVVTHPGSRGALLNEAARRATGDVLLIVHADTLLPTGAAAAISAALAGVDIVGGAFHFGLDDTSLAARLVVQSVNLRTMLLHTFFGDQAMFVRRVVFLRTGGFRDWNVMEDLEILSRLRRYGRLVILDPAVVTSARRHRSNGWLKTVTTIWGISLLYRCGVPGDVLFRWYQPRR